MTSPGPTNAESDASCGQSIKGVAASHDPVHRGRALDLLRPLVDAVASPFSCLAPRLLEPPGQSAEPLAELFPEEIGPPSPNGRQTPAAPHLRRLQGSNELPDALLCLQRQRRKGVTAFCLREPPRPLPPSLSSIAISSPSSCLSLPSRSPKPPANRFPPRPPIPPLLSATTLPLPVSPASSPSPLSLLSPVMHTWFSGRAAHLGGAASSGPKDAQHGSTSPPSRAAEKAAVASRLSPQGARTGGSSHPRAPYVAPCHAVTSSCWGR